MSSKSLEIILNRNTIIYLTVSLLWHIFPGGADSSDSKESACSAGDPGSIPGSGRSPGEGNGNPLQYSCLENSMERIAWRTTVHGVEKSRIQLGNFHFISQVLLVVKNPAASAGDARDASLIPGLGRSSGLGIGKPLQNSCLGNPMDRGTWWATVHGVAKSWTQLSNWTHTHTSLTYQFNSVAQSCPTLCDPMECRPPGPSIHGIFQQEYWGGLPCPAPGDLPNPGIESMSPALQVDSLSTEPPGKPY